YGEDKEAKQALNTMIKDASKEGLSIRLVSGYRSYQEQVRIYASNVAQQGEYHASIYSARAGFSEHQSGLTFDLGGSVRSTDLVESFGDTKEGKWLADNAHKYGFIIRFLKDKEEITGYAYEPWHVRYVGVEHSTAIKESGQCLEEYLGLYPFE
ncbi:MAG: M15 family metallopeptidase, partial [Coprobacillus sp.]